MDRAGREYVERVRSLDAEKAGALVENRVVAYLSGAFGMPALSRSNDSIMASVGNSAARCLFDSPQAPESHLFTVRRLWQESCRGTDELGHRTIRETSE